ncbi:Regulator of G-protein signaling [Apis cerana cerana]|uniref:Regulator of G-protein signaling n=1 Tax=Apis cerana cerana TaxID=94128 RepID=A0A2A3E4L8_APICC|nr:Regulator of G-protein signaling [Apis cerana cerana]
MEASNNQQQKKEPSVHRPCAFDKMEGLVREMQDPENGVPVRSQKQFLTSIPSAFMGECHRYLRCGVSVSGHHGQDTTVGCLRVAGYDLIEWLMERLSIEESVEAVHIANQLCQYGYFFPVNDSKTLTVRDDSSLYRFQTPCYWPWQHKIPDNMEYAIYLAKRTLRNKQRHALEDYEIEALNSLRRNLQNKWDMIQLQAEEQVALLKNSLTRTRIKVSAAIENFNSYFETYMEYDPMFVQPQPSNPWITDDQTFWQLNSPLVEIPTEKRVKRWALSMEELMSDPTGLQEFTQYLRKEYSHENIRFWLAVKDLRHSFQAKIPDKVNEIFREFLAPGAPCEINIDGKTMEKVHQEMKNPNRFTFDSAAEHVYTLLLKKDCYPRFIRSDQYRNLLASGVQPSQKKWFFFGGQAKKKVSSTSTSISAPTPTTSTLQHHAVTAGGGGGSGGGSKRRGSDRSLSGSAHELAICGIRDMSSMPRVPHSHSQSNLTDIPYRGDLARLVKIPTRPIPHNVQDAGTSETSMARPVDDVCPWDVVPGPSIEHDIDTGAQLRHPISSGVTSSVESQAEEGNNNLISQSHSIEVAARPSRKNSSQFDSCSSSSDVSLAVTEAVSEHLRKSCSLQQSSSTGGGTSTSERVGMTTRNYSIGSVGGRAKLGEIGRPSASSFNYPSPQHSLEYSHVVTEIRSEGKDIAEVVETETRSKLTLLEKEHTKKTLSKAPLISISAIVGDLASDSFAAQAEERKEDDCGKGVAAKEGEVEIEKRKGEVEGDKGDVVTVAEENLAVSTRVETETEESLEEAQVVPVWEPDTRQDDQIAPVTQPAPQQKRDNNVNEVCPWEDEENCRVDAPYVKTYATLGYL